MSADSLVDDFYLDVDDNNHEIVADAEIKVQAASDRTDSTQSTVDIKKRKYGDKQQQPVMNKKPAIEIPPPLILSSASDIQQHIWDAYSYDQKRKWTEIERADAEKIYRIPLEAIRVPDESKFKRRPVQSSGDDFNEFLRSVFDLKSLKRPIKNRGKPRVVVICNSAIRCTEIIKQAKQLFGGCKVAKLFSKHFKIQEQIEYLRQNDVHIAVGTPNRLLKLHEECGLFTECGWVVLDGYRDSKQRTLLTMSECKQDFFQLLSAACLPRMRDGEMFLTHY